MFVRAFQMIRVIRTNVRKLGNSRHIQLKRLGAVGILSHAPYN